MSNELSIIVKLQDNASAALKSVRGEMEGLGDSAGLASKGFAGLEQAGKIMAVGLGAGLVLIGKGFAGIIEAGSSFESAFAGIVKTVDGVVDANGRLTESGLEVRDAIRDMAMTIPLAVDELARIGELGGQLGIAKEELISFTDVVARLAVTTDLTAEAAAMGFAKFAAVMGTTQGQMMNVASSLVWLGNNFATTESQVLSFAQRITNAGVAAGMTEADVLGIAAAFTSVGVQAEVGGTSVQKVIYGIELAAATGGEKLNKFAEVAGMSSDEFRQAWNEDAAKAFQAFIMGLGTDTDKGLIALKELELADQRVIRAFMSLAAAGDTLSRAMEGSRKAFEENNALLRESGLRFQTLESQWQLFKNIVNDLAISLYDSMRPALAAILHSMSAIAIDVGPKIIAFFSAISGAIMNFTQLIIEGTHPIDALRTVITDLAMAFGATAEQAAGIANVISSVIGAILQIATVVVQAVTSFYSWKDVLVVVAVALGAALVALLAWAAPMILALTAVATASAVLRNAWESDFLGIRTAIITTAQAIGDFIANVREVFAVMISGKDYTDAFGQAWSALPGPVKLAMQALQDFVDVLREGGSIVDAFKAALPALGQAAQLVWGQILLGLQNFGNSVAQLAATFLQWLTQSINSVNWYLVGSTIVNAIALAIIAAVSLIDRAVQAITTVIMATVSGEDWGKLGTDLVNAISNAISAAADGMKDAVLVIRDRIFEYFGTTDWGEIGQIVLDGIRNFFTGIGDKLGDVAANILNAISNGLNSINWEAVGKAIIDGLAGAAAAAVAGIVVATTAIVSFIEGFFNNENLAGAAQNFITALGNAISGLAEGIKVGMEALQQRIFEWAGTTDWGEIAQKIIDGIRDFFLSAGDKVGQIIANLATALANAINSVSWAQVGEFLIKAIATAITALAGAAVAIVTAIVSLIEGAFTNEEMGPAGKALVDALSAAVSEFSDGIQTGLDDIEQEIFDWADTNDWSGVWEKIIEGIFGEAEESNQQTADGLEKLEAQISDWAETTDWSAVWDSILSGIFESAESSNDMTADGMQNLFDSIAEWAANADWAAIADTIVEAIFLGLGIPADSVDLSDWVDALTDEAGNVDWDAVAEYIVEMIFLAFGLPGEPPDLSTWLEVIRTAVENLSWLEIALAIIDAIVTGLLDFGARSLETVSGWLLSLKAVVPQIAWAELAAMMLANIALGLLDFALAAAMAVQAWLTYIKGEVSAKMGALIQIGIDIIAGVKQGISQAMAGIGGWFSGMGPKIEAGVKNEAQTQSPSRLTIPVGHDIMAGIGVGIKEGMSEVGSWFAGLGEGIETAALKELGEAIAAIASALGPALLALQTILAFDAGDTSGFKENLAKVTDFVRSIVIAFAEANSYSKEALATLADFTDAASSIVELIADAMLSLAQLNAVKFPTDGEHILAQIQSIRDFVAALVAEFALVASELGYFGPLVEDFTAAAASVIELLADAVLAIAMLNAVSFPTNADHLIVQIITLAGYIKILVGEFARAAAEYWYMSEAVIAFVEAGSAVVDLVDDALTAVVLLAQFDFGPYIHNFHLAEQIVIYRKVITNLVREFAGSALEYGYLSESVQAFAEAGAALVELVADALEAVVALAEFDFGPYIQNYHLREQIIIYRKVITTLVREFSASALEFGFLSESVKAFAEAGAAVVELVDDALAAVITLSTFDFGQYVGGTKLSDDIAAFREIIRSLVASFAEIASDMSIGMIDHVQKFAAAVEVVIALIGPAVMALQTLSTITGAVQMISLQAVVFSNAIMFLVFHFGNAADQFSSQMLEKVKAFADTAGSLFTLIGPAIEGLAAISTLTGAVQMISLQAVYLSNAVMFLVFHFSNSADQFSGPMMDHVKAFADAAGSLFDLIGPAIEGIAAIASLTGAIQMISLQAVYLSNAVMFLVFHFSNAAKQFSGELLAHVQEFSDAAGSLFDMIETAIGVLLQVASYVSTSGLQAAMTLFANDIVMVITTMVEALRTSGLMANEAVIAAGELSETIGDILDMVGEGIEALAALNTYVPMDGAKASADAFAADLVIVLQAIVDALAAAGLLANQAVIDAGELGGAIEDILGAVGPAIEGIVFIIGYTQVGGLKTNAQAFAADLAIVVQAILDGLSKAGLLANASVVEAGEMAKSIDDILKVVDPAIGEKGAITQLTSYVTVNGLQGKTEQFSRDLVQVVQTLVDGLTQSSLAAGVALQKAGEMAKSIEDLFKAVTVAIAVLGKLAEYSSGQDLLAKTKKFTDDMVAVSTTLVTGLTQAANNLGQAAIAAAKSFSDAVVLIVTNVQTATDGLGAIGSAPRPDVGPVMEYITKSAQQIAAAAASSGIVSNAGEQMAKFRDEVTKMVDEVLGALAELARLVAGNAPGSVGDILAKMLAAFNAGTSSLTGAGKNLGEAFINGWNSAAWSTMGNIVNATLAAVITSALNAARGATDIGQSFNLAIAQGMLASQGILMNVTAEVIGNAVKVGMTVAKAGSGIGHEMVASAAAGAISAKGMLDGAGAQVGQALIDGMARSITAGKSKVVSAIIATINAAIAAAKAALGIASPSKVFAAMAEQSVAGLVVGFNKYNPALAAVDGMMNRIEGRANARLLGTGPISGPIIGPTPGADLASGFFASVNRQPAISGAPGGPVSVTINISGTNHSLSDIKSQVEAAVDSALTKQGRRADAMKRINR